MDEKIDNGQKQRNVFAFNFKRCLSESHKTQADIVRDLGVTSSTVSDWANAKKYPRVDKMQALADYLGVLLSDLREEKLAIPKDNELSEKKQLVIEKIKAMDDSHIDALNQLVDSILRLREK